MADLDSGSLLAAATAESGLEDFGDADFRAGFDHYVESVNSEARVTPMGLEAHKQTIGRLLANRLRHHRDLRRHPEIAEEDVTDPIFILGLPRTGTTKLYNLMSADPGIRQLLFWQAFNPAPFDGDESGGPDPRIGYAIEVERAMSEYFPDTFAMHPWKAEEVEEEFVLHEFSFMTPNLAIRSGLKSTFLPWLRQTDPDQRSAFGYASLLLQYLQWQDPDRGARRWVLKNILALGCLPTLLECYPSAVLVQCHRDPVAQFGSMLRLFELVESAFTVNDDIDLARHGRVYLEFFAEQAARNVEQRKSLDPRVTVVDVYYEDVRLDPYAVLEHIHSASGSALSQWALDAARHWDDANPQHRYGQVTYSLDRYGLTAADVAAAFRPYVDRFGLESEAR